VSSKTVVTNMTMFEDLTDVVFIPIK